MSSTSLSFVGQIKAEYREACNAETGALQHAIKCGEYLALAKENVQAEKAKWSAWLQTNCPEVPQTTASLYMRLAEHKDDVAKAKSIREADKLLRKRKRGQTESERTSASVPNMLSDSGAASSRTKKQTLEDELQVLAPDEMCKMLVDAWDDEHLRKLASLIYTHLQKKPATGPLARPPISNAVASPVRPGETTYLQKSPSG